MKDKWGNTSQVDDIREHPIHRWRGPPSPMGKAKRRRLGRKKGSQPRLAALGSPFQGKGLAWTLPPSYGRRCPEGAEVGWGKRDEKDRGEIISSASFTRAPERRCAVPLPQWGRLRYEDAAFLASSKRIQDTWRKRITTDKAFPAWGRWRAERAG